MTRSLLLLLTPLLLLTACNLESRQKQQTDECTVSNIVDGDSIVVSCKGRRQQIRLYCIDAPEMKQRPWGKESRTALRQLLKRNDRVTLTIHDVDSYGRQVAEVFRDGLNLNLRMIEKGKAAVYRRYCRLSGFYTAEKVARRARVGIWSREGLHQSPWKWRRK